MVTSYKLVVEPVESAILKSNSKNKLLLLLLLYLVEPLIERLNKHSIGAVSEVLPDMRELDENEKKSVEEFATSGYSCSLGCESGPCCQQFSTEKIFVY